MTRPLLVVLLAVATIQISCAQDSPPPFIIREKSAQFPGGMQAFYRFVSRNLVRSETDESYDGVVVVSFSIGKDGQVIADSVRTLTPEETMKFAPPGRFDVKKMSNLPAWCASEAVRVIRKSPPWIPGELDGQPVIQKMIVPISFKSEP